MLTRKPQLATRNMQSLPPNFIGKTMAKTSLSKKITPPTDLATVLPLICNMLKNASSSLEASHYEAQLERYIQDCMENQNDALEKYLQALGEAGPPSEDSDVHGPIFDAIRTLSESITLIRDGISWSFLLVAAPVIFHSNAPVPKTLKPAVINKIHGVFERMVAAKHAEFAFLPGLYGEDELPFPSIARRELTMQLAEAVLDKTPLTRDDLDIVSNPFFDDIGDLSQRFLIGVIGARTTPETPYPGLFRWNGETKDHSFATQAEAKSFATETWSAQVIDVLAKTVPNARLETALPAGASHAMSVAASRLRPHQLMALLRMVASFEHRDMPSLKVSIAPFGENYPLEYRIGILDEAGSEVIDGMAWQISSFDPAIAENLDESPDVIARNAITNCLKMVGCKQVFEFSDLSRFEDCEDCGSPLYLNRHQELCHPTHAARESSAHSH
jgi:hypothetical protein